VVLGSRGFGPLPRAVMGSVSSNVVRHSHTSVLIVRGEGVGEKDRLPGTILVAIDGSREVTAATQTAVEIANGTDSDLHVLYALETEPYIPHLGPEAWEGWQAALARVKKTPGRGYTSRLSASRPKEGRACRHTSCSANQTRRSLS
jgi:nucleotide-binding universal stress UspA family protein